MSEPCVLIVEGDILVRNPLAEYLRECGYQVLEATNADEARQLVGSKPVDVLLANADAPPDGGFALAVWVQTNCPACRFCWRALWSQQQRRRANFVKTGPL